ncbi:MAG TPA: hypothetical protein PK954_01670 [Anaerolineales bacterium]|nr:hypothetical protein [Anaerolineales bacterium]HRF47466.1 hypothetical protein [Anaerolineales bacterium]
MVDEPMKQQMHAALDDELDGPARSELEARIAIDPEAVRIWAALQAAEQTLQEAPILLPVDAPRYGFSSRFKARLAQRRRSRPAWLGALALGASAFAPILALFGSAAAFLAPLARAAGQPSASLALQTSAEISMRVLVGLASAGLTVLRVALSWPAVWAALAIGLVATFAWLIWMGRLVLSAEHRPA